MSDVERAPGRDGVGGQCNWPVEHEVGESILFPRWADCAPRESPGGARRSRPTRAGAALGTAPKPRLCVVTQSSVEQSLYGGRRPNWRKPRSRPPRAAYGVNLLTVRGGGGLMAGPPIILCSRGRVLLCSRGGPRPFGGDPPPGRRRPQPAEASPSLLFRLILEWG